MTSLTLEFKGNKAVRGTCMRCAQPLRVSVGSGCRAKAATRCRTTGSTRPSRAPQYCAWQSASSLAYSGRFTRASTPCSRPARAHPHRAELQPQPAQPRAERDGGSHTFLSTGVLVIVRFALVELLISAAVPSLMTQRPLAAADEAHAASFALNKAAQTRVQLARSTPEDSTSCRAQRARAAGNCLSRMGELSHRLMCDSSVMAGRHTMTMGTGSSGEQPWC